MTLNVRKYIIVVAVLCLNFSTLVAQNLAQHNWYFGNSVNGIRFNRGTNKPQTISNKAIPFGTGGSAVATDPATADLWFYTDGANVYDAYNKVMPNGTGLTANTAANQPVVICAVPGQTNKYYIFTNTANSTTGGAISRSVVDMTLFGNAVFPAPASGNLENPKNVAITGLTGLSEGMIIVPHANGTDFWLITQLNGTQSYSATLINAATYTTGTFTSVVTSNLGLPMSVANFSYNPKNKKLAVSPGVQTPPTTYFDAIILNFDNATGKMTFDQTIFNSGLNSSIYDIEWDHKGQYLYIAQNSLTSATGDILQFDYLNPTITLASVASVPEARSYGLQFAPDSALYHIYQAASGGPYLVERFTKTDTVASSVIKTATPFGSIDFLGTQFPSFLPKNKINLKVSFTSIGTCQNNATSFFPVVSPNADSLNWDFGDSHDTTAWSPVHTYTTAQTFNVKLKAYYQGQEKDTTQTVTITPFTLKIQLVQDTTACRCELPGRRKAGESCTDFSVKVKVTQGTATSYAWSNGDTGATLKPDSAGYYYVVVTDNTGCSTYAGVNVKEYGLQDTRRNIWYFGTKAGIDFNKTPPKALSTSAMDAPAGCAIVCDRNGQAIFYTDGDKIFDKTNTQIDVGIGGDPLSSQSALIVPVPGDETLYYIFTTQSINGTNPYEVRYSMFDLKQNNGKGAVTKKNILLFSKSTERVTASAKWLIVHEYGNNTFRSYKIGADGIGDPVYSAIGSDHSFQVEANGQGYMKLGPKNELAVALSTPGVSNLVELFKLNDTTGMLRNYRKIDLKEPTGQVYGVEFSPGGNKVFATVKGPNPSTIFEYSLDSLTKPHFKQKVQKSIEMGAIVLAPDNQIYMAINGSSVLGTIAANDDTTKLSAFNFSGFTLASGTKSQLGLPNFIQQQQNGFGGPGFTFTGLCLGDSTHFSGQATDAIDKFQWFFGDGGSSTQASPVHLYAAAGTYTVSMHLTNRCHLDTTIVQKVTINPPPAKPTIPGAAALCNGPVNLNANTGNVSGLTYQWTSGDTTKIVTITKPAVISVTNTDKNGCSSTAQSIVVDNRPQLNLGPDLTICQNNATPALDAQNPGDTYSWTINGVVTSTTEIQAVDTSSPGTYKYSVTVTDPITTCTITSNKTYSINVSPSFTFTGTNPTSCGTPTGTLSLTINPTSPLSGPYTYFITGPGATNNTAIDQSPQTLVFNGKRAGTYSATVTDQISGCSISNTVGLNDAAFTYTATQTNCDPSNVAVNFQSGLAPTPTVLYTFTNSATGAKIGPSSSNLASLQKGNYTVQVVDKSGALTGCTYTFPLTINPVLPTVNINASSLCATSTLVASVSSGSATYSWTGPGIVAGANTSTITVNASGTYQVTAMIGGTCPITQQTTITYSGSFTPNFTQSNACATQVILTATPVGNYTYRWYKNGTFQSNLLGSQISLTAADNGSYQVEVVDAQSGCAKQSAAQNVQVIGTVTASLTSTQACQDDKPFTLTATTNAIGATYAWSLNGTVIPSATAATLDQTSDGTYKVDISLGTCKASASIQIIKAPVPQGLLPTSAIICNDPDNKDPNSAKVDLNPGSFVKYNWFKNQVALNFTQQIYTADSEGLYEVDITNSFGCTNADKTNVVNDCTPKIVAPNAFRPTSSLGANQHFSIFSFFITDNFEVLIFNRWGELIYESKDRHFKWNGGYNNNAGQPLPGGTYAYVIRYVSSFHPDQGVHEQRGGVVLLR